MSEHFVSTAQGLLTAQRRSARIATAVAAALSQVLLAQGAQGATYTINAYDAGWYDVYGFHDASNRNYYTNYGTYNNPGRASFFAFSLPNLQGRVVESATFSTYTFGTYNNPTLTLRDVGTSAATVTAGGSGLTAVSTDLATGSEYGSGSVATPNATVSIALNSTARAAIQSASSGRFLMGGALSGGGAGAYAFANSYNNAVGISSYWNGYQYVDYQYTYDFKNTLSIATLDPVLNRPTALPFGNVLVGASKSQSYQLGNGGPAGTTLIGTNAAVSAYGFAAAAQSIWQSSVGSTTVSATFNPTQRGSRSATQYFSGNASDATGTQLTGTGVAPVVATSATLQATPVRIGTTGTVGAVNVSNVGDGNLSGLGETSNLRGSIGTSSTGFAGGGTFSLADGTAQGFGFTYTATARGSASGTASLARLNGDASGNNAAGTSSFALQAHGVGPEFASDTPAGGTLDFGTQAPNNSASLGLRVSNITPDIGYASALTGLTLLSYSITGSPVFSLTGFTPGMVLGAGTFADLVVGFDPTAPGLYSGLLTFVTDQGTAFGGIGDAFSYDLTGMAVAMAVAPVPEPSEWAMMLAGLGMVGLIARRRRVSTGS